MTPAEIKSAVEQVQAHYSNIEHEAWNPNISLYSKPHMQMWIEASQIMPPEWREIIRVLAQGGDYYGIEW